MGGSVLRKSLTLSAPRSLAVMHVRWKWSTATTLPLCLCTLFLLLFPDRAKCHLLQEMFPVAPGRASASSSQLCNSSCTAAPTLMKFLQGLGKSSVSVPSTALHLGAGHRTPARMKLQEKLPRPPPGQKWPGLQCWSITPSGAIWWLVWLKPQPLTLSIDPGDKNLGERCQLCELEEAQLFERHRASVKTLRCCRC